MSRCQRSSPVRYCEPTAPGARLALAPAGSNAGRRGRGNAIIPAVLLALAGCTVGPDFHPPAPPAVVRYTADSETTAAASAADAASGVALQRLDVGADIPALWWQLFHCPALNRLVERALAHGNDVAAAQAALAAAREDVLAQQGAFWPQVGGSFSSTRQLVSNTLASPLLNNDYAFNLHTAQLNVSYVPDVFGGNKRLVESLQAQAEAQAFQLQATRLTLAANVVLGVVEQAALQAEVQATEKSLQSQSAQLDLTRLQLRAGQLTVADVATQESSLASLQATLPALQKQLAQQRTALAALLGELPDHGLGEAITLADLELPAALPLSLPSRLVEQRPDVRAAEAQLHAASAQIGVATADRLPNLTLGLQAGGSAAVIARVFDRANIAASVGATLTQPLFDGGTLLHRQRAAEALYAQSQAQYRGVVVTAFQNVADALHAIDIDAQALATAQRFDRAAGSALGAAQRRFDAGDANRIDLLIAQQAQAQSQINLVQAQASRLADTAALVQALGGGWRQDTESR